MSALWMFTPKYIPFGRQTLWDCLYWLVIFMFTGEYTHSIDKKNRIIIPTRFREELGESFIMSRGYDGCLYLFTQDGYKSFIEKNSGSCSDNNANLRKFTRFFVATICSCDGNGRVIIPESLKAHGGIEKDVISIGLNDHIEIWDRNRWQTYITAEDFTDNSFAQELDRQSV